MRKEIFLAILAGGAFGLLIAFAVWKLNFSLKTNPSTTALPTPSLGTSPLPQITNGEFKIIVNKPQSLMVLNQTPTEVSGVTNPGSIVVISGEDGDEIITASENGSFSGSVGLAGGINQITITAFDANGNEVTANIIPVYSGQFQTLETGVGTAYLGTVTDITDSIIQIKNDNGDIEQVKPAEGVVFVNNRNNTSKTIKESDVAIGDYLIAMGTKGANNIMDAIRIVVTDVPVKPTRRVFLGMVSDDKGFNKFVMKTTKTGEEITVTPATGIDITGKNNFGQIVDDDKLIVVGEFTDSTIEARTIQILK